jgi:hypothetical protein
VERQKSCDVFAIRQHVRLKSRSRLITVMGSTVSSLIDQLGDLALLSGEFRLTGLFALSVPVR